MDALTEYIFKQGLGYALFVGSLGVSGFLLRQLLSEKDKRAQDLKEITALFVSTSKDLLNGNANLQKSVETIVTMLNNNKH